MGVAFDGETNLWHRKRFCSPQSMQGRYLPPISWWSCSIQKIYCVWSPCRILCCICCYRESSLKVAGNVWNSNCKNLSFVDFNFTRELRPYTFNFTLSLISLLPSNFPGWSSPPVHTLLKITIWHHDVLSPSCKPHYSRPRISVRTLLHQPPLLLLNSSYAQDWPRTLVDRLTYLWSDPDRYDFRCRFVVSEVGSGRIDPGIHLIRFVCRGPSCLMKWLGRLSG